MRRWAIVGLLVAAGLAAWSFGGLRPAEAACAYSAASNSWPCRNASPAGSGAALPGDVVLGFRPSLGAGSDGPLSIQQITGGVTTVANQAALKALAPSTTYTSVDRAGYTTAGDGGGATYSYSSSACSLNSGAGDNGSQVQAQGGGCWLAKFGTSAPSPKVWGCAGNGSTNDATCMQAAVSWAVGGQISLGCSMYAVGSTITLDNIKLTGCSSGRNDDGFNSTSGFVGLTAGMTVLSVGNSSILQDFTIEGPSGSGTSGAAIATSTTSIDDRLEKLMIWNNCDGIELNGNTITVNLTNIYNFNGSGCAGIKVGNLGTNASTTDMRVTNGNIYGAGSAVGMMILDAGGLYLDGNDIGGAMLYGTEICPGTNQGVWWLFATNTVLGDTTTNNPLHIDTCAASASIRGLKFDGTWTANNTTGPGININNLDGGTEDGIWFIGHRQMGGGSSQTNVDGIDIGVTGTVVDVSFDGSHVCGGSTSGAGTGIYFGTGAGGFAVRGTQINQNCGGEGGTLAAAIGLNSNANVTIVGNDLCGNTKPVSGTPTSNSVVEANRCLNSTTESVASATSIALLDPNMVWNVTGTTTVENITGWWLGMTPIYFVTPTGAVTFSTGGTSPNAICNSVTSSGANSLVSAFYVPAVGCWAMQLVH